MMRALLGGVGSVPETHTHPALFKGWGVSPMQSPAKLQLHLFISFKFIVVKHRNIVLKWMQKSKVPQRARSTMKKKNRGEGLTLQNTDILHSYNNKSSMVLAKEQRAGNRTGLFINEDLTYD